MKKDEFRRLAEDVSKCHICERLVTLPHIENSECLENDDHGLNTEERYGQRVYDSTGEISEENIRGFYQLIGPVESEKAVKALGYED